MSPYLHTQFTILILIFTSMIQTLCLVFYKRYLGLGFQIPQMLLEFTLILLINLGLSISINVKRKKVEEGRLKTVLKSNQKKAETLAYISALNQFKTILLSINNPTKISQKIEEFMQLNFSIEEAKIFFWSEEHGVFIPHKGEVEENSFHVYNPLALWITDYDRIFFRGDFRNMGLSVEIVSFAEEFFDKHNADVLIPLLMNSSLVGLILISGKNFIPDENTETFQRMSDLKTVCMMALSNSSFYTRLINLTENLEIKVKERTRELEETQAQLIMSEKMASLGVMVAGIAHEINTPSGVISNSSENLEKTVNYILENVEKISKLFYNPEISKILYYLANEILNEKNVKALDSKEKFKYRKSLKEKFEIEGLERHLSDELSNFIIDRNYLHLEEALVKAAKLGGEELIELIKQFSGAKRNITHIQYSIRNIVRIVRALKQYSHLDQAENQESDIREGLDTTLIIMGNQLKHGIEIIKNFKEIPSIPCNPDELNQVWTNLIQNAVHAMKEEGTLIINVFQEDRDIVIEITDNGPGIPPQIQEKVWDPFFTTKDQGQGSGLGLGIVKGIIEKHKGKISLYSVPGQTTFRVSLPAKK